ncbi:MAG: replication/maintenance protein RepL [Gammaproteobacteria bacterium]|nr:replication/maintenance protein RepL [Gammaproteobacteria bacterium]
MTLHESIKYTEVDEHGNACPVVVNTDTGEFKVKKPRFKAFNDSSYSNVAKLAKDHYLANAIFHFLVENMDRTNALVVSYDVMQEHFGKTRRTLYNGIKYLRDNGYINIIKSGNMNVYCVNAQIVWNQSQNKIHTAKFNATVYVSNKEQIKYDLTKKIK